MCDDVVIVTAEGPVCMLSDRAERPAGWSFVRPALPVPLRPAFPRPWLELDNDEIGALLFAIETSGYKAALDVPVGRILARIRERLVALRRRLRAT